MTFKIEKCEEGYELLEIGKDEICDFIECYQTRTEAKEAIAEIYRERAETKSAERRDQSAFAYACGERD